MYADPWRVHWWCWCENLNFLGQNSGSYMRCKVWHTSCCMCFQLLLLFSFLYPLLKSFISLLHVFLYCLSHFSVCLYHPPLYLLQSILPSFSFASNCTASQLICPSFPHSWFSLSVPPQVIPLFPHTFFSNSQNQHYCVLPKRPMTINDRTGIWSVPIRVKIKEIKFSRGHCLLSGEARRRQQSMSVEVEISRSWCSVVTRLRGQCWLTHSGVVCRQKHVKQGGYLLTLSRGVENNKLTYSQFFRAHRLIERNCVGTSWTSCRWVWTNKLNAFYSL